MTRYYHDPRRLEAMLEGLRQACAIDGRHVIRAGRLLADKVKVVAAHLLNASPEAISLSDGMVHVAGAPEMRRTLREIAEIAYGEPGRLPPGMETGLEAQYRYDPPPMTFTTNPQDKLIDLVQALRTPYRQGAVFVQELDEVPDHRPVIFSAHGVPKAVPAEAARIARMRCDSSKSWSR